MTTSTSSAPAPPVLIQVNSDGTGWVHLPRGTQHVAEPDVEHARVAILTLVSEHAAHQGQPVLVHTTDPDGSTGNILVAPDMTVTLADPPAAAPAPVLPASPHTPVGTVSGQPPVPPSVPAAAPARATAPPAPAPAPPPTTTPISTPPTLVTPTRPSSGPLPQVWRAVMEEKSQAATLPTLETTASTPQVRHIVVLSLKGGVGKTTTTVGLGQALAQRQEDHVIALDGDHYGTLTSRFPPQTRSALSMAHLARDHGVDTFVSLRRYLSAHARLQAMDAGTVTKAEFEIAAELAQRFADTVITDCRTDLTDPTAQAALGRATGCVIVIEPAADAMAAGHRTLEHLAHRYPALARTALFVVCHRARRAPFRAQPHEVLGRPVFSIPFDRHLSSGGVIEPKRLRRATRAAYSQVGQAVIDLGPPISAL